MVKFASTQGPGKVEWQNETVVLTCTGALSKGDIVELTLADEGFAACTAAGTGDYIVGVLIGVALADVAAGALGEIGMRGVFECAVDSEVQAVSLGLSVSRDHAGQLDLTAVPADDAVTASKVVGISLDADGSRSDGDLATVLFDGISGFSSQANHE